MASNHTISAHQLTANKTIVLKGQVLFSRIASMITAEEAQQRARTSKSMYPTLVPHTTISINNAQVQQADPNQMSIEEVYITERMYTDKNTNTSAYSIDNKSDRLPPVFEITDNGQYAQIESLQGELDRGLNVRLVLKVIQSRNPGRNPGIVLDAILVDEPVRYYGTGGIDTASLEAMGIVFTAPPTIQQSSVNPAPEAEATAQQQANVPAPGMQPNYQPQANQQQYAQAPQYNQQQAAPNLPTPNMQAQPQQQAPTYQPQAAPAQQFQQTYQPQANQSQQAAPQQQAPQQQAPADYNGTAFQQQPQQEANQQQAPTNPLLSPWDD